ncbi:MAG: HEXXH motif-containing putative peptide modification protein [Byssovorax sp.]
MASPLALPRDLTIPEPGSTTAREVLSRSLGRLLPDLAAIPRALPGATRGRAELEATIAAAQHATKDRAGAAAVMSALRSPTVGALLRSLRNELRRAAVSRERAEAMLADLSATLAFELALAGALSGELRLTRLPPRILSLTARAAIAIPADAKGMIFAAGRATLALEGERIELDLPAIAAGEDPARAGIATRPYHPVAGAVVLATVDNNPRAAFGAEPWEPGNPVDLGGHAPDAWAAALRPALEIIAAHLPDLSREIELYIREFVPTGHHPETHRSASYRESIGAIYLTLHPNVMTLAEAILHEFSHNKLHALFELDPVIENDAAARFSSPVRPDPRPLRGVLLAVHAFLPVARLYEKMTEAGHPLALGHYFPERFAQIRGLNREGAQTVFAHARPTPVGGALIDEMRRWIAHFGD